MIKEAEGKKNNYASEQRWLMRNIKKQNKKAEKVHKMKGKKYTNFVKKIKLSL